MLHEKVLFAYVTLIREGMVASGVYHPDAVLHDINHEKNYSLAVTAGFITKSDGVYWNEIDVTFNNETVISPNHDGESNFRTLLSNRSSADQYVTISSFYLKAVRLPKAGIYTATVSLFSCDEGGQKGHFIDSKECLFVVAEEYQNNG
ncbi:hypothetical protein ACM55O_06165 [Hafnia paralvei]|uniref:hypothetical protein n=1 Tax=Hafnia paralvei TaxID=546367 RepID=UPI0039FB9754